MQYHNFINHIPESLVICDNWGYFLDVNRQACKNLGYSRNKLLTLNFSDLDENLTENKIESIKRLIIQSKYPLTFQGTIRRRDGSTFPAEIKVDMSTKEDEPFFIVIIHNISHQKRQQQSLQDHKDLLRVVIDSIPDIICIKDGRSRWLLANRFDLHLFDLETVNYRGKTDAELAKYVPLHNKAFHNCLVSDERAWQKKSYIRNNEVIPVKNGKNHVFDVYKVPIFHDDGRRKALVVIGRDITELKQVEEKFRTLFELSPLPYLSSSISNKILTINESFIKTFGYQRKDIVGKNFENLMTPSSRHFFAEQYPRFLQGAPASDHDYEMYQADGTVVLVQILSTIIKNDAGIPISIQRILIDITKQRRIEKQIQASEERYRQLFEQAPIGIVLFNTNFHVTHCNDNYLYLMHTNREQMINSDLRKIWNERMVSILIETIQNGKKQWWEGIYQSTNDEKYISLRVTPLYDSQKNIRSGMAIIVDLTEKKHTQAKMNRLMLAIEQASESIVITNTEALIEYVNPAFEKMTGYSFEEVQGQNPCILQSGYQDKEFYTKMWQTLSAGKVWRGHLINKRKDGTFFEEDATISPVCNHKGRIINYVAVKRDVTKEVTLTKQLNQAIKMEAIGTLAGGIAHDFNNIVSAILGYAEMVEMQVSHNDPVRQDIKQIIVAGNRAADLVKQILAFSRQEEKELKPVKIQYIVREVLKLIRATLPSTIKLHTHIDNNCGYVLADSIRIHQVLMNLCTNAKQAMENKQGELHLSLSEKDINSLEISNHFPSIQSGRFLDLIVSDTGNGIEPNIIEKIFDPFFTTKKKAQGTGLGLSVVHGIVKNHGGEITVTSKIGQGTTFHVYLPVINMEQKKECPSVKQVSLPQGDEHILLVDDEPLLVDLMKRILEGRGYIVDSYTDSRKALAWFNAHMHDIDLVITDMTMPNLTGVDLAKKILKKDPQMPIILCTGYSDIINEKQAKILGIKKYLAKPIDNIFFAETVRKILDTQKN